MKNENDLLIRLFQASARAPQREAAEIPLGFETRVFAALNAGLMVDDSLWILMLFRRAMLAACAVTALCIMVSYTALPDPGFNELTFADSILKLSVLP